MTNFTKIIKNQQKNDFVSNSCDRSLDLEYLLKYSGYDFGAHTTFFWGGTKISIIFFKNVSMSTKNFLGDVWGTSDFPESSHAYPMCSTKKIDF